LVARRPAAECILYCNAIRGLDAVITENSKAAGIHGAPRRRQMARALAVLLAVLAAVVLLVLVVPFFQPIETRVGRFGLRIDAGRVDRTWDHLPQGFSRFGFGTSTYLVDGLVIRGGDLIYRIRVYRGD
jgi:hypothetical protein